MRAAPVNGAAGPADVDGDTGAVEEGRQDSGVAGDASGRLGGEQLSGVQLSDGDVALQRVQVDGDDDPRGLAAIRGQLAGAQGELAHVDQRVGAAGGRGA